MAHEIDMPNSKANMAYAGETPWHGLGQVMEEGATIEKWAEAAGMQHTIKSAALTFNGQVFEGKKVLYRDDTGAPLSVVGKDYKVVQPIEVLEFFKNYVNGAAVIETAGVLKAGRQYWALAKLDGEINIAGDITKPYLMLATSCDGSLTTQARLTSVRVVCNNTLSYAARGIADVTIRHNSVFEAATMSSKLEGVHKGLKAHGDMLKTLASAKISEQDATRFLANLANCQEDALPKSYNRILELFLGKGMGADMESAKGTAYGLLQAVTQHSDWEAGRTQETRLFNSWFGRTGDQKLDIANKLLELV